MVGAASHIWGASEEVTQPSAFWLRNIPGCLCSPTSVSPSVKWRHQCLREDPESLLVLWRQQPELSTPPTRLSDQQWTASSVSELSSNTFLPSGSMPSNMATGILEKAGRGH